MEEEFVNAILGVEKVTHTSFETGCGTWSSRRR